MLIYEIINKINNKKYIGQTKRPLRKRWYAHVQASRANKIVGVIPRAIKKYGEENFSISILAEAQNQEELNFLEKLFIIATNSLSPADGYNLTDGGNQNYDILFVPSKPNLGKKFSAETKKKMSIRKQGIKRAPFSAEHKQRLSQSIRQALANKAK